MRKNIFTNNLSKIDKGHEYLLKYADDQGGGDAYL